MISIDLAGGERTTKEAAPATMRRKEEDGSPVDEFVREPCWRRRRRRRRQYNPSSATSPSHPVITVIATVVPRRPLQSPSAILLLLLLLLTLPLRQTSAREADERARLLYAEDPVASRHVMEYQLHSAPSEDYAGGDEQRRAALEVPGNEYDEERHIRPYFLQGGNGPRVVQYYSPWCG